jgi:GNAT superfamily N-acetyltransferase
LLQPLDPQRRSALVAAMQTIRTLLGDESRTSPVVLRPHRIGELGWLVHRQGLLYNQQYGWNGEFEALIARIYNEYATAPDRPPRDLWIAERNGEVAGSIFCMPSEGIEGSAQLRMLYVEPAHRGHGIGRMLVDQCVAFARGAGYARMRLWTHTIQEAARKLYAGAGFTVVESEPHTSFGKSLVSEIWELRF